MIPISLKISGFLSYREPVVIDFTPFDLAAISGANGSGKSSLLDAITWAIFGQARRRDDSLIHNGSQMAEVILDFEYEHQRYRIQRVKPRGKTTLLEFSICGEDGQWRPLTEHSLRETEARIQQTLRMDYDTFTNASFLLQGKADQFAQQKPGERKRILSSILGLEVWEVYREEAARRRKLEENQLNMLDGQLKEIEKELAEEEQRRAHLAQLEAELERLHQLVTASQESFENLQRAAASLKEREQYLKVLANNLAAERSRLQASRRQLAERQQEREQYLQQLASADQIEAAYRAWQDSRKELERWEAVAANFRQYEQQRAEPLMVINSERARLEQEQRNYLEQQAQAEQTTRQLAQIAAQLQPVIQEEEQLVAHMELKPAVEQQVQAAVQLVLEKQQENRRFMEEMQALKDRIKTLEDVTGATCPVCGQPLSAEEQQKKIEALTAEGKALADQYRANQALCKQAEKDKLEREKQLREFTQVEQQLRQVQLRHTQLAAQQEQLLNAQTAWQSNGAVRLAEIQRILEQEDYAHEARQQLARIDEALKDLGYDAAAHAAVQKAEMDGRASEELMRQLSTARAALAPLEREIEGLAAQVERDAQAVRDQEAQYLAAEQKYQEDAAQLPDLDKAEREMFELKSRENQMRMQVGAAAQSVEVLSRQRERQRELNNQRDRVLEQINRLRALERAFSKDGVPALLIEQALPEIEAQANEILERLTDGAMSVRFRTQREYKDKKREDLRETLDIEISDPAGPREYELFSGGEAFRVNFAIRLALSRVLAQRAGARLQTLVIDEGFGSQDVEGRQRLLEAINLVKPDFAKVMVITHLEELKDAFPARIEVEKTASGSQVRVVTQ